MSDPVCLPGETISIGTELVRPNEWGRAGVNRYVITGETRVSWVLSAKSEDGTVHATPYNPEKVDKATLLSRGNRGREGGKRYWTLPQW